MPSVLFIYCMVLCIVSDVMVERLSSSVDIIELAMTCIPTVSKHPIEEELLTREGAGRTTDPLGIHCDLKQAPLIGA